VHETITKTTDVDPTDDPEHAHEANKAKSETIDPATKSPAVSPMSDTGDSNPNTIESANDPDSEPEPEMNETNSKGVVELVRLKKLVDACIEIFNDADEWKAQMDALMDVEETVKNLQIDHRDSLAEVLLPLAVRFHLLESVLIMSRVECMDQSRVCDLRWSRRLVYPSRRWLQLVARASVPLQMSCWRICSTVPSPRSA
jgi:hypothetical protein